MAKKKQFFNDDEKWLNELHEINNNPIDNFFNINLTIPYKTTKQKEFSDLIGDKEVVIATGPAGSGKTFIACLKALQLMQKFPMIYKKIVLIKSVTPLPNEELGFIKGSIGEKMDPFIYSFWDNFKKIIGNDLLNKLKDSGKIEVLPVAYTRGLNFDNQIVILDEAQNLTKDHLITLITRIGFDAKLIILGDAQQIDIKEKETSGLTWLLDTFKELEEIGTFEFTIDDVVRNPLIIKILNILNK
jgi:phosphate starvation-inducible PhoH-like protein